MLKIHQWLIDSPHKGPIMWCVCVHVMISSCDQHYPNRYWLIIDRHHEITFTGSSSKLYFSIYGNRFEAIIYDVAAISMNVTQILDYFIKVLPNLLSIMLPSCTQGICTSDSNTSYNSLIRISVITLSGNKKIFNNQTHTRNLEHTYTTIMSSPQEIFDQVLKWK